jgi:hypothetical protein
MESLMYRFTIIVISAIFLTSCDDNIEETLECPLIIEPKIIPAIRVNLFDSNKVPLNICDAIVTINNTDYYETFYGSATNFNCADRFSLEGGYNLVEHNVFIEKAGFVNQEFKAILPIETQCSYETFELDVYLQQD